jgi:hypothetical protein
MDYCTKEVTMKTSEEITHELIEKIHILCEKVWSGSELDIHRVKTWIDQFKYDVDTEDNDQIQFLFLLSKFMYFGDREIKELLISVYRDLYRYRIIKKIRQENGNTLDSDLINRLFNEELENTRFLGMGKNPSESGSFLLYYFRQVNNLRRKLFINPQEIFHKETDKNESTFVNRLVDLINKKFKNNKKLFDIKLDKKIKYYVFLDDICGSGTQGTRNETQIVNIIKSLNPDVKVYCFVLFGMKEGIEQLKKLPFDTVECIFELDESFKCFSETSRFYKGTENPISKLKAYDKCFEYDTIAQPEAGYERGFKNGQLLISLDHNTPNNVPPIFWGKNKNWQPVFKRYDKKY